MFVRERVRCMLLLPQSIAERLCNDIPLLLLWILVPRHCQVCYEFAGLFCVMVHEAQLIATTHPASTLIDL